MRPVRRGSCTSAEWCPLLGTRSLGSISSETRQRFGRGAGGVMPIVGMGLALLESWAAVGSRGGCVGVWAAAAAERWL